jgi:DNA-binding CsgD family transcriptional regulator/tetratricopeptide (TPR) repeat protein
VTAPRSRREVAFSTSARALVGREDELELLQGLLRRPRGLIAVSMTGDPGIGKTRLLAELRLDAQRQGAATVLVRGTADTRSLHLWMLQDLVEQLAAALPLDESARGELCGAFDVLAGDTTPSAIGTRYRLWDTVVRLIERAAEDVPLLICLDDAHWVDPASTEFLVHLLGRHVDAHAVLVLSHRPRQTPGGLAGALAEAPQLERLELGPLSEPAMAQLVGAPFDPAFAPAGGNPLYLLALAEGRADEPAPGYWSRRLGADLHGAPVDTRTVAHAAAVLGDPIPVELLPPVAELSTSRVAAALDQLAEYDLIRSDDSGGLVFRHPLVARAVYADCPVQWRREAHHRSATALRDAHAPPVAQAPHLLQSAREGDVGAAVALADAADAVSLRDPVTAVNWYERSLSLLPPRGADLNCRVAYARARALCLSGRLSEGSAALHTLLDGSLPAPSHQQAVALAAATHRLLGQHEQSAALLQRELDDVGGVDPARVDSGQDMVVNATALFVELAATELVQRDWEAARRYAAAAVGSVDPADRPLRGASESIHALALCRAGDVPAARTACDRAAVLVDGLTDDELASRPEAALWAGDAERCLARYRAALRHQQRAIDLARGRGLDPVVVQLLLGQARARTRLGQLRSARRCAEQACDLAAGTGSRYLLAQARMGLAATNTLLGDHDAAERLGRQVSDGADGCGDTPPTLARAILAWGRLEGGDARGCQEEVLTTTGGPDLPMVDLLSRPAWYHLLTRAAVGVDDVVAAKCWVERAREAARTLAGGVGGATAAFALLAEAELLQATGSSPEAALAAHEAAERFDRSGNVLDAACAALLAGQAHAASGARKQALDTLAGAEASFLHCGAMSKHAETARELRRLGRRVPVRADRGQLGGSLTGREKEVARLVAAGLTNREIGGELYLSEKTVERHLSHLFLKLQVSNRAAVAATMTRS